MAGSTKAQDALTDMSSSIVQPTPEFHVYAESVFTRFEPAMFEPTPLSGGLKRDEKRTAHRGSIKSALVKISLDEIQTRKQRSLTRMVLMM